MRGGGGGRRLAYLTAASRTASLVTFLHRDTNSSFQPHPRFIYTTPPPPHSPSQSVCVGVRGMGGGRGRGAGEGGGLHKSLYMSVSVSGSVDSISAEPIDLL